MGGAYIGLSDTAEGGYYNPAGLVFSTSDSFSASANIYSLTRGKIKDALQVGSNVEDIKINSFMSIPSTAAYLKRFNFSGTKSPDNVIVQAVKQEVKAVLQEGNETPPPENEKFQREVKYNAIGLNVMMKDLLFYDGKIDFPSQDMSGTLIQKFSDQTLYIGPSYSRLLNEKLSIGISWFYSLRAYEELRYLRLESGSEFAEGFRKTSTKSQYFEFLLGSRYNVNELVKVGFVFKPPSIKIMGNGEEYYSSAIFDVPEARDERKQYNYNDLVAESDEPMRLGLGLALEKKKNFAIAFDFNFYFPNSYWKVHHESYSDVRIKQRAIFNTNLGAEYYIRPWIPVRAGFYTNFSSAPEVADEANNQLGNKIDYWGTTASVGFEGEHVSTNFGVNVALGRGNALSAPNRQIVGFSMNIINLFIAGSYTF